MGKKKIAKKAVDRPEIFVAKSNEFRSWMFSFLMLTIILPGVLSLFAKYVGSDKENPPHFLLRLLLALFLDSVYGGGFYAIFLPPSRILARMMPGAKVPSSRQECERQENQSNDPSITWPLPGTNLPPEWIAYARTSGRKQPFFLNHVRGSTRLRQAVLRITAGLGTLAMVYVMTYYVDHRELSDIGLTISTRDFGLGLLVGSGIILLLFILEVALGWVRIVGLCEVVVPGENLIFNLLWDIFFHIGVSINEEVSMRGWILVNTALYIKSLGASASSAMALSVALQSSMFAMMHVGSPGASRVGIINLVVGGAVAALNVFLSGGLSFSIGWHFGWNIFMGHLLGLSTSGIPMSAKLVSVVPDPAKGNSHGGKFGPENSPLAIPAYLLGFFALVMIYGVDGISTWDERLLT